MPEFDPYLKWLGIRESIRPINHYRLLGLDLFESDADVISMAADRQMAHIRTFQCGPNGNISEGILGELAIARRCLLSPEQKNGYDNQLRSSLEHAASVQIVVPDVVATPSRQPDQSKQAPDSSVQFANSRSEIQVRADTQIRKKKKKREKNEFVWSLFGWISGGLAALGVGAWLIGSGLLPGLGNDNSPELVNAGKQGPIESVEKPDSGKRRGKSGAARPDGRQSAKLHSSLGTSPKPPPSLDPDSSQVLPREESENIRPRRNNKESGVNWNESNLNEYPAPDDEARHLADRAHLAMRQNRLEQFNVSSSDVGTHDFKEIPAEPSLLIGFAASKSKSGDVKTLQAVFLGFDGAKLNRRYGRLKQSNEFLLAKPGYAVGAIEISSSEPIKCFRLTFMKIKKNQLDPSERYKSKWFGKRRGAVRKIENPTGMPVIGIYGQYKINSHVCSLGLIAAAVDKPLPEMPVASVIPPTSPPPESLVPGKVPANSLDSVDVASFTKSKIPSRNEVDAALNDLMALHGAQLKSANNLAKGKRLVTKLLRSARFSPENPAECYVAISKAAEVAIRIGDARMAVEAIRELDEFFEIDFWKLVEDAVDGAAENSSQQTEKDFKLTMDELIQETIDDQNFNQANRLITRSISLAKRATDHQAVDEFQVKRKQVQELGRLAAANAKALPVLKKSPNHPEANENCGDYQLIVLDNNLKAFEYWARSGNEKLKLIARLESNFDALDKESIILLGSAWEAAAKSNRSLKDKKCIERALELYRIAQPMLEGPEQSNVTKKIERLTQKLKE